jgi:hypothetical protein
MNFMFSSEVDVASVCQWQCVAKIGSHAVTEGFAQGIDLRRTRAGEQVDDRQRVGTQGGHE